MLLANLHEVSPLLRYHALQYTCRQDAQAVQLLLLWTVTSGEPLSGYTLP